MTQEVHVFPVGVRVALCGKRVKSVDSAMTAGAEKCRECSKLEKNVREGVRLIVAWEGK